MLVICEFYEHGEDVYCDVMCEHCGEVALETLLRETLIEDFVLRRSAPILCKECADSKCPKCGAFPVPSRDWNSGDLCPRCKGGPKWWDDPFLTNLVKLDLV